MKIEGDRTGIDQAAAAKLESDPAQRRGRPGPRHLPRGRTAYGSRRTLDSRPTPSPRRSNRQTSVRPRSLARRRSSRRGASVAIRAAGRQAHRPTTRRILRVHAHRTMTTSHSTLGTIARRLRAALDATRDALVDVDLAKLIAAEPMLCEAIEAARASARTGAEATTRAAIRADLVEARAALSMCRRLGSMLAEIEQITAAARGENVDYTRQGHRVGRLPVSSAIEVRV